MRDYPAEISLEDLNLKEIYNNGIINVGNLTRMKRVMEKANAGKALTVSFIGGSITAGAAATEAETCYAYLVYDWWKNKFPMSKVKYYNAGVGATTSEFAVARVEQEVLSLEPDIVFVEFSVNDSDAELYQETFEGLIRKTLMHPSEPAVFIIHNVFYDDGRNAQRVHSQIGLHYDLPVVSMKESIYREIQKGRLRNTDISADNLHPNDLGHRLVAGIITNLLDYIYDTVFKEEGNDYSYLLPATTLTANRYFSSARSYSLNASPKLKGFVADDTVKQGPWDVFRYGWFGQEEGSSILFEVEGSLISVQYRKYANHPAPIAKCVIDGNEEQAAILDANFDETWGDCLYLQDILEGGKRSRHTIEITITEATDKEFYLASIITA